MAKDEATTGDEAESNVLTDKWGNERPWEGDKYPDGSPAKEGHITKPSGQGGAMPKSRPDHQDMFPANPEPSATAKDWGERLDRYDQGETDVDLTTPLDVSESETKPAAKTTTTTTKETTK